MDLRSIENKHKAKSCAKPAEWKVVVLGLGMVFCVWLAGIAIVVAVIASVIKWVLF